MIYAIKGAREWQSAQPEKKINLKVKRRGSLPQLPQGLIKCFTAGAWREDMRGAGMGWIFKSEGDSITTQGSGTLAFVPSALAAEALAIKGTLNKAIDLGYLYLGIFSDSQSLIQTIIRGKQISEIYGTLTDI
ncbi:uncharacterized protein LOC112088240 [Eutrema salsugineum]|uniref:uncharacterized protein LOC112088240 n=1 Tax=Eutrema salsugineum TaxID=72664 RepID=UPI000CECEBA5|nr:uncharacterized protein LOC112088240 [Eutrema salsugineum]